ncbi:MAG: 50S ribosomal protein L13 [Candidatus Micrarchaeaceae archaeon]
MELLVDGKGKILGRIATKVAKELLNGNSVYVVNAEEILISGHKRSIAEKYKKRIEFKDKANPEHSPYWSRKPELLVKRAIRGMLPRKKAKGREAFKRLRVYAKYPQDIKAKELKEIEGIKGGDSVPERLIKIKDLSSLLGYKV